MVTANRVLNHSGSACNVWTTLQPPPKSITLYSVHPRCPAHRVMGNDQPIEEGRLRATKKKSRYLSSARRGGHTPDGSSVYDLPRFARLTRNFPLRVLRRGLSAIPLARRTRRLIVIRAQHVRTFAVLGQIETHAFFLCRHAKPHDSLEHEQNDRRADNRQSHRDPHRDQLRHNKTGV